MKGQMAAAKEAELMAKLDVLYSCFKGQSARDAGALALECLQAGAWKGGAAEICSAGILEGPDAMGWLDWLGELTGKLNELSEANKDIMLLGRPYMDLSKGLYRAAAQKLPDAASGILFYRRLMEQDLESNRHLGAEGLFALASRFPEEAEKCADAAFDLVEAQLAFRPVRTVAHQRGARVAKSWFMAFAKNAGEEKASSLLRAICAQGRTKDSVLAKEDEQWRHGDMEDEEFLLAVEGLLAGGAKPNIPDSLGQTALRHLNRHCEFRSAKAVLDACSMFFEHGAQPDDLLEKISPVEAARGELKGLVQAQCEKAAMERASTGARAPGGKRKL